MNEEPLPPSDDFEPPPPPEKIAAPEEPQMSEVGTVTNIFIEPGRTFEDLNRKPRFVLAGILIILLLSVFNFVFTQKIGLENIVKARIESTSRTADLPKEQKDQIIAQQSGPVAKYISIAATPIVIVIIFLLGGLLYWLGTNAFGGSATFSRGLSVWVYSGWPPALLFTIANFLVLFLKNPEEIDVAHAQQGLIQAGPALLLDQKTQPVLFALVSSIDLIQIIGWALAVIGLKKVGKVSTGSAITVVALIALIGIGLKVALAALFG